MTNYYDVLGVVAGASQDEIKRAYKKKAKESHPDLGGSDHAFAQINVAYEVLSNEESRARYDAENQAKAFTQDIFDYSMFSDQDDYSFIFEDFDETPKSDSVPSARRSEDSDHKRSEKSDKRNKKSKSDKPKSLMVREVTMVLFGLFGIISLATEPEGKTVLISMYATLLMVFAFAQTKVKNGCVLAIVVSAIIGVLSASISGGLYVALSCLSLATFAALQLRSIKRDALIESAKKWETLLRKAAKSDCVSGLFFVEGRDATVRSGTNGVGYRVRPDGEFSTVVRPISGRNVEDWVVLSTTGAVISQAPKESREAFRKIRSKEPLDWIDRQLLKVGLAI